MTLEAGSEKLICHKEFPAGYHKEAIKIKPLRADKNNICHVYNSFYSKVNL